jgi:hydrogenase maturation protease
VVGNLNGKKILSENNGNILILGIGNVLMGDEGIGSHVAQFLSTKELPQGIRPLDGGTGGFYLLEEMQEVSKIILIDATCDGKKTGTVTEIKPRYSTDYPRTLTAHDIGLKDLLDAFYLMGKIPEIHLFAVSISSPNEVTTDLTPEIEQLVPELAQRALTTALKCEK